MNISTASRSVQKKKERKKERARYYWRAWEEDHMNTARHLKAIKDDPIPWRTSPLTPQALRLSVSFYRGNEMYECKGL